MVCGLGEEVLKIVKSLASPSYFKSFSRSLEHFFLTLGSNNFENKIPNLEHAGLVFSTKLLSQKTTNVRVNREIFSSNFL